jgi:hypothetical protein
MVRARFSENLARLSGDPCSPLAYLTGLFSLLDALLDRPLEEALGEVGLAPEINAVLLGRAADGTLARIHRLVRSYEAGAWEPVRESAQSLGLSDAVVACAYVEATEWTNQVLRGLRASESTKKSSQAAPRKERRRSKRDPITGSVSVIWGNRPQEERLTQANLIEVSPFGARFRLPAQVPTGSWLMFNHHKIGISGRGTVRHSRLVKGQYEIGVEFSSGTGWDAAAQRFGGRLRNLGDAIGRLQAGRAIEESETVTAKGAK